MYTHKHNRKRTYASVHGEQLRMVHCSSLARQISELIIKQHLNEPHQGIAFSVVNVFRF